VTSIHIRHPERHRVPLLYSVSALVVFAAVLAASLGAGRAVRITVDGAQRSFPAESTVGDLAKSGALRGTRGDMLAADGSGVAREGGGKEPVIARNGRIAGLDQRLYNGDVVDSEDGVDTTESMVETRAVVPMPVEVSGHGSIEMVVREGRDGVKVATVGAVSGLEVTSTIVQPPVARVVQRVHPSGGDKLVALTFDDGPWPGQTERVLDILRDEDVPATFFVIGSQANRSPNLIRRAIAEGHQIGNHTWGHAILSRVAPSTQTRQIVGANTLITRLTGSKPTWFRPPGGHMTAWSYKAVAQTGMQVAMWDVDPQDWTKPPAYRINERVFSQLTPGSVVLLHDGGGDRSQTIGALPSMIREMKRQGYSFVTVEQLSAADKARTRR